MNSIAHNRASGQTSTTPGTTPKKILWFVDKQFDAAPDRVTWVQALQQLQSDHDVHLATGYRQDKSPISELDNEVMYISSAKMAILNRCTLYYNQIRKLEELIGRHRPEVLLFNSANLWLLKKASDLRDKYTYSAFLDIRSLPVSSSIIRNRIDTYLFKNSLQIASRYFDGVTYITRQMEEYCRERFHLPDHRSAVWTSGVDIQLFQPTESERNGRPLRVMYHGTIANNRGLDKVIKAFDLLRKYNIELFLLGCGNGVSELRRITARLKLSRTIIFHPPVPYKEVPGYINQADVGILPFPHWPGWNTSSPIKLFEYLACGKPVIVTNIPAHATVLQGSDFAYWAERSTTKDISQAIERAYAARTQFDEQGRKARSLVAGSYTWEEQARKLARFICSSKYLI